MVEGYANITVNGVTETVRLNALELASIVASRRGFAVVDAQPTGIKSNWQVTAESGPSATVRANGSSLTAAVSSLIESIW